MDATSHNRAAHLEAVRYVSTRKMLDYLTCKVGHSSELTSILLDRKYHKMVTAYLRHD